MNADPLRKIVANETDVDAFWSHVDRGGSDECWSWKAGMTGDYGCAYFNGKQWKAHRLAYHLSVGPIPIGAILTHRCSNPACCNPSHLVSRTVGDNNRLRKIPIGDKFLKSVEKGEPGACWIWTGARASNGAYGKVRHKGELWPAHRAAWDFFVGEIPIGMCVCHRCDTPLCVNPKHLFLGTHLDNMQDMAAKGRSKSCGFGSHPENTRKGR